MRIRRTQDRHVDAAVWAGVVLLIVALIAGWVTFCTWLLMTAWNYVMPNAFGWPELTFWQAFAISVVLNLLTSGLRASVKVEN